jgi:hypothetical protein
MYQVFGSKTLFPYSIFHFLISSFDDTSFIFIMGIFQIIFLKIKIIILFIKRFKLY